MSQQMGIYRIANKVSGKAYIGSAINVSRRMSRHLTNLRLGQHSNGHLQRAFNRYGEEAFEFDLVEPVDDIEILREREQFWIDSIGLDLLYNINPLATKPPNTTGRKLSPEHKRSIFLANKGRVHSDEIRKRMSQAQKGRKNTPEQKARLLLANLGRSASDETKAKMSLAHKGRVFSPETRRKISEAQKGKIIPPEQIAKSALARKGIKTGPRTPETKAKISHANGKTVMQVDPATSEVIATFHSTAEAGRVIGVNSSAIRRACYDNRRKSGGYYWRYAD